ncbi:hypothetical protein FDP41_013043 [Naegleria fowleri]|uniref:Uncharacterized protein n=1 Tax=Naegleria fowleri TaxID=5763 RepID=A0A6A5C6Y0_NAEFO|nr:uncharacterized protein FDP41_013043 [Naegleria fowleri]KAF0981255.1 hypothetical protein FDP41_013043 [Naegleria fowleri]
MVSIFSALHNKVHKLKSARKNSNTTAVSIPMGQQHQEEEASTRRSPKHQQQQVINSSSQDLSSSSSLIKPQSFSSSHVPSVTPQRSQSNTKYRNSLNLHEMKLSLHKQSQQLRPPSTNLSSQILVNNSADINSSSSSTSVMYPNGNNFNNFNNNNNRWSVNISDCSSTLSIINSANSSTISSSLSSSQLSTQRQSSDSVVDLMNQQQNNYFIMMSNHNSTTNNNSHTINTTSIHLPSNVTYPPCQQTMTDSNSSQVHIAFNDSSKSQKNLTTTCSPLSSLTKPFPEEMHSVAVLEDPACHHFEENLSIEMQSSLPLPQSPPSSTLLTHQQDNIEHSSSHWSIGGFSIMPTWQMNHHSSQQQPFIPIMIHRNQQQQQQKQQHDHDYSYSSFSISEKKKISICNTNTIMMDFMMEHDENRNGVSFQNGKRDLHGQVLVNTSSVATTNAFTNEGHVVSNEVSSSLPVVVVVVPIQHHGDSEYENLTNIITTCTEQESSSSIHDDIAVVLNHTPPNKTTDVSQLNLTFDAKPSLLHDNTLSPIIQTDMTAGILEPTSNNPLNASNHDDELNSTPPTQHSLPFYCILSQYNHSTRMGFRALMIMDFANQLISIIQKNSPNVFEHVKTFFKTIVKPHGRALYYERNGGRILMNEVLNYTGSERAQRKFLPLHCACSVGNLKLVKYLLRQGANRYLRCFGELPEESARLNGHFHVVLFLRIFHQNVVRIGRHFRLLEKDEFGRCTDIVLRAQH